MHCAFFASEQSGLVQQRSHGSKEDEMKHTAHMIAALAALLLMALVPAYAQKTSATANIPFAFTVDDVRMPAGEYLSLRRVRR